MIVVVADTFASISNISPKIYKEFVFPYYKACCAEIHRLGGVVYVIALVVVALR